MRHKIYILHNQNTPEICLIVYLALILLYNQRLSKFRVLRYIELMRSLLLFLLLLVDVEVIDILLVAIKLYCQEVCVSSIIDIATFRKGSTSPISTHGTNNQVVFLANIQPQKFQDQVLTKSKTYNLTFHVMWKSPGKI